MHMKEAFAGGRRNTYLCSQSKTNHFRAKEPEQTGGSWGTSVRSFLLPVTTSPSGSDQSLFFPSLHKFSRGICALGSPVTDQPPWAVPTRSCPASRDVPGHSSETYITFSAKRGLTLYFHQFSLSLLALKDLKINPLLYLVWFWSLI